jgi:hypothetical protein
MCEEWRIEPGRTEQTIQRWFTSDAFDEEKAEIVGLGCAEEFCGRTGQCICDCFY